MERAALESGLQGCVRCLTARPDHTTQCESPNGRLSGNFIEWIAGWRIKSTDAHAATRQRSRLLESVESICWTQQYCIIHHIKGRIRQDMCLVIVLRDGKLQVQKNLYTLTLVA